MNRYPSVEVALNALQARNEELERLVAERTAELSEARRRADVDAALDRVRTLAMTIQHSDETLGVAVAVFEALQRLGLPVLQVGLSGRATPDTHEAATWVAGVDGDGSPRSTHYVATVAGHPALDATLGMGALDEPVHRPLGGPDFEAYLRATLARYPPSYAERAIARAPRAPEYHYVAVAAGTQESGPLVAVLAEPPSPDALRVLERFSVLFGLAYSRHRALQQAEGQARLSQIEAALERVRARALAMQRSADLAAVVGAVIHELGELGVHTLRSGFAVLDEATRRSAFWSSATGVDGPVVAGTTVLDGHPFYDALYRAWRQQRDLSYILEGGDLRSHRERLERTAPPLLGPHAALGPDAREYVHAVAFPSGVLFAFSERPFSQDTVQVLQRMASAFQFAYTRHLDLQQAEAQARETAQAASVDRVRAEIASMRTVADLDRITPLIWEELTGLGVPFVRCGVFIVDEATHSVQAFLATPDGDPLGALRLPLGRHPLLDEIVAHWHEQSTLTDTWDGAQMTAWAETLRAHGLRGSLGDQPDALALHFAPFAQGMLYVGSPAPLSAEDGAAVQALADAFEVAYARYDDFQRLEAQKQAVEAALAELRATQQQLVQSEKLASLGALTAGIAHEIKNPLNFVNNFASLSREIAAELAEELDGAADPALVQELLEDLQSNTERIETHGRRADSIVRGMMQHARGGQGQREPTDLNALVDEHVNLAFHGRRAQVPDFNVTIERDYGDDVGEVEVVPQEIGRVLINLVSNAFDAVSARAAAEPDAFTPTVRVATVRTAEGVEVRVADNGAGIPEDVLPHVFDPFFTTKPTGQGTGLGLSMSHDIVEFGHGGRLDVESEPGRGATFVVGLPC